MKILAKIKKKENKSNLSSFILFSNKNQLFTKNQTQIKLLSCRD